MSVARARPDIQGVPLTRWSLPKLCAHLAGMGIVLSPETLIGAGLSHQRTRSWKWSPDPDFAEKAERVLGLYRQCPPDGVVVCFDEMGPIQLIPHHGSGWAVKRPERLRATYSSTAGCATCSAPTTCTPTASKAGCAPTKAARKSWGSTARSACATGPRSGST